MTHPSAEKRHGWARTGEQFPGSLTFQVATRRPVLARSCSCDGDTATGLAPPIVDEVLRSPGRPLEADARTEMEAQLGHDFSRVRVHDDSRAGDSARQVHARAYTVGASIVFGPGQYAPRSPEGRRLLAHELAHVLQQRNVAPPPAQLTVAPADGPGEHEANIAAATSTSDDRSSAGGRPIATAVLQRQTASPAPQAAGLRLVFFQSGEPDSSGFQAYAKQLATNLGALVVRQAQGTFKDQGNGSMSCNRHENVLVRAAKIGSALGRKIQQLHVVGHVYPQGSPAPGPACLQGAMNKQLATAFDPAAKIVVHGCQSVARYSTGTRALLTHLPGASVYAHSGSAEAGGPLEFVKQTADPQAGGAVRNIVTSVKNTVVTSAVAEDIGFTAESVGRWAANHVAAAKKAWTATGVGDERARRRAWSAYKQYVSWLTLPLYASDEMRVFAEAVKSAKAGAVGNELFNAATKFVAARGAKPAGSSRVSP